MRARSSTPKSLRLNCVTHSPRSLSKVKLATAPLRRVRLGVK